VIESHGSRGGAEELLLDARILDELRALHECGLTLAAWKRATAIAPPSEWRGTRARIVALRLLHATGAPRQSSRMAIETWRADRRDAEACLYMGFERLRRRGPLSALEFMDGRALDTARWHALRTRVLAQLRDFDGAERALRTALARAPEDPWIRVERVALLADQDRYTDALAAAREALSLAPDRPAAVHAAAHVLQLLNRDGEALELLSAAAARMESGELVTHLAAVQHDLELHAESRASYDRVVELSPSMELRFAQWLCARRSDAAYLCGDLDAAIELARASQDPFHLEAADRMKEGRAGRRVRLPVRFVRQHHMSCAPATLAAVSELWSMPADHLQVVEAICYDGTPTHSERRWAEQNGWSVREFTVTWQSAKALLDRGVAFTLATTEPGAGHLQAVIGYDERRGVLLLRDPSVGSVVELNAEPGLKRWAATGPRGMALVPLAHAALLDGLTLPDAAERDLLYEVDCALHRQDRAAAEAALLRLEARSAGHPIAIQGRRALASYDGDPQALLGCADALLALFPDDPTLLLAKVVALRQLGRRSERMALLEMRGRALKGGEPLLWVELAEELRQDARRHDDAIHLLRRALRYRPAAAAWHALADLFWEQHRRQESLELYRFASCLEDKNETHALSYFLASRALDRTEEALRVLRERFERFGDRSSLPVRTLFRALQLLNRSREAFAALDRALDLRPDDFGLLLHAADENARCGDLSKARDLLGRAGAQSRGAAWQRAAATIATYRCDQLVALEHWREVLKTEPLAMDAHESVARLLAETERREAALAHLERACARFPHHWELHKLWLAWLGEEDPRRGVEVARTLLESHPSDAWARRELAIGLQRAGRDTEAFVEMEAAAQLEPRSVGTFNVRGALLEHVHRVEEAREQYRESLRLEVDQPFVVGALLRLCGSAQERRRELEVLRGEIRKQVLFGRALLDFQREAKELIPAQEVLDELSSVREARQDLWEAWSACIHQQLQMRRNAAALELAKVAAERFPLIAAAWRDLAAAHAACGEHEAVKAALERALQISPGWPEPVRMLADAYERERQYDRSRALLERAVETTPLDCALHGYLADALWMAGEKEQAKERLRHALSLQPEYLWAWNKLREWGEDAAPFAREMAARKPWSGPAWLALARVAPGVDERLAALEKAAERQPRLVEVHDLRAAILAEAGRWDEALAACRPAVFGDLAPVPLRGREAWVVARRGDRKGAIARLRELVTVERDYSFGFSVLIELCREERDPKGLLEAAAQLAVLEPRNAYAQGTIGEANLLLGDKEAAKAALKRAVDLEPGYRWAAIGLFDLELERGELDAAGGLLAHLERYSPGAFVAARSVQLAARRGDRDAASARLAALCAEPSDEKWPLEGAARAIADAGWREVLQQVLGRALDRNEVHPHVGAVWLEHVGSRVPFFRLWPALRVLRSRGEVGIRATEAYLQTLARLAGEVHLLFLMVYRRELRANLQLWAAAGYALVTQHRYRRARRWLSDYRARKPEAWMMINVIAATQACGRDAEADAAVDFAAALPDAENEPSVTLWRAFRAALAGDPKPALELAEPKEPTGFQQYLRKVSLAVAVSVDAAPPSAEAFREARRLLAEARETFGGARMGRPQRRMHARAVARIGRDRGGAIGFLWRVARHLIK
jgi:tetratricopeptide (TPR) repeat protein